MVRLLPVLPEGALSSLIKFQSHNGAIAARMGVPKSLRGSSFNPTMVRLLLRKFQAGCGVQTQFQSHNGAIAAKYVGSLLVRSNGFNPTMVRLLQIEPS